MFGKRVAKIASSQAGPGDPSELVQAFDRGLRYVVIEGHSPASPGWHRLPMTLTDKEKPTRMRAVRRIRFDMCMSPHEAIDAGPELDDSDQGWLYAWQVPLEPPG